MGAFFVYILKSSLCLAVFYLFYRLLLSKETFHRCNRIASLSIILLSYILPLATITTNQHTMVSTAVTTVEDLLIMYEQNVVPNQGLQPEFGFPWQETLIISYVAGAIFFILCHLWSLGRMLYFIRHNQRKQLPDGTLLIIQSCNFAPFSWMKYIVISQADLKENGHDILLHEQAHIRNHHSWDLLLVEVCSWLQWFNPAIWLLKQELQNIHEYEADEEVLRQGIDARQYQMLLIKKAVGARLYSIANSFNHSSLKKRIAMMLKQKSSPWARLKYLYVLPLAALTVVAFARPEISHELEKISSVKISEIIPVQEKKEPKRNVEVETLARDSVVFEKDMQAIQEKVSAVMEKYQPEIDKAVEEAVKAANIDEIVSAEMAKHQAEIDKAVQAAIEAAKIDETIAAEMEKIQPEINRTIEEAMKAIDINEKAAKEASKVKSSFSGIVYIDGVESSKERMDNLNPDRIASMNVYKGNEAIAKFGEKGRNGVIEIKLKK